MKKFIAALLAAALIAVSMSSCGEVQSKNPEKPDNIPTADTTADYDLNSIVYRTVAETDAVKFEINNQTTDIKITDKSNGYTWSTEGKNDDGSVTRGNVFNIKYYNTSSGSALQTMSSAEESVGKGQYRIEDIENGVKVTYGVGDVEFKRLCPNSISKAHAEELFPKWNEEQRGIFDNYYTLIDFNDEVWQAYTPDELAEQKKLYPLAAKEPCYYPTYGLDNNAVGELNPIFSAIGYTEADKERDNGGVDDGSKSTSGERAEFQIAVYYTLENNQLKIKIPESEIYNSKKFVIDTLEWHPMLTNFGAKQQGYFFLPDGSGSVMNFTNGKDVTRNDPVYINMYGVDASRSIAEKMSYYNDPVFPVYGTVVQNDGNKNGIFAIIESGDAFAGITARSSDGSRTRNMLVPEFRLSEKAEMEKLGGGEDQSQEGYKIYQFQRYLGDIAMSYSFLNGDNADYSGMAKIYEKYLFGENTNGATKPYYSTVELVGAVMGFGNILGVNYDTQVALTSYEQAETIVKDLNANGFNNMNVKLSGWTSEGYTHDYMDGAKVSSLLGGESAFKSLLSTINSVGAKAYPDANVQYTLWDEPKGSDQVQALNRKDGEACEYDPVDFQPDLKKGILNMNAIKKNLNDYLSLVSKYDVKTVSLGQMGQQINANYKRTEDFMERQETLENLEAILKEKTEAGFSIMGTSGVGKLGKYMTTINELPLKSAQYDKCDYSVPFAAMVYSGHVDYTGKAINISNNDRSDLLRVIENGAGANYKFTGEYYDKLNETTVGSEMFSTVYSDLKDYTIKQFDYLKTAQKDTYGQKIVKHERLADGVFKTTFANGKAVVVNYNKADYNGNGVIVKAEDYTLIGGAN